MSKLFFFLAAIYIMQTASANSKMSKKRYETSIKNIMDLVSGTYSEAFQFAMIHKDYEFVYSAGIVDQESGKRMKDTDMIPLGSLTKPYTVSGVVQEIEAGRIGWNTTIAPLVKEMIKNDSGGRELSHWFQDEINNVTIYQLIFMSSGLPDYKDDQLEDNYTHIKDFELKNPVDYFSIMMNDGKFLFKPGHGDEYSSIGYILLQYALATLKGAKTWREYDQFSIFPDELRSRLNRTMFIDQGKCQDYAKDGLVPTYSDRIRGAWPATEIYYTSFWNITCANGWGMGNIAVSAKDAATFWYEYLGTENIISDESKAILFHWGKGGVFKWNWYKYGGGLMFKSVFLQKGQDKKSYPKANEMIGHSGMDYGSETLLTGFNFQFNYSMVLSTNTLEGASCQERELDDGNNAEQMLECLIQDLSIQYFSEGKGPRLNCTQKAYAFQKVGQKMLSLSNTQKRIITAQEPWKREDQFCSPQCYHCFSGGKCSACQECKKNDKSKKCKKCRKQKCISRKKNRCEICWNKKKKEQMLEL